MKRINKIEIELNQTRKDKIIIIFKKINLKKCYFIKSSVNIAQFLTCPEFSCNISVTLNLNHPLTVILKIYSDMLNCYLLFTLFTQTTFMFHNYVHRII